MMRTKKLIMAAFFCALTAVLSQITVAAMPVPFALSLAGIFLAGALLDKKTAFFSALLYLLVGAVGFPVFSGASGGLSKLFGPTGGYLLAYPVMAFFIALLLERFGRSIPKYAAAMLFSLIICYILGTVWLTFITHSLTAALSSGVVPFLLPDIIKIALCAPLSSTLYGALSRRL